MAFFHFEGSGPAGQGDPQPHVVWQQREKKARKPRKAIGNGVTRTLINLGVTLLFAAVYFYVALPPMNLHSEECYVFLFLLLRGVLRLRPADLRLPGHRGEGLLPVRQEAVRCALLPGGGA